MKENFTSPNESWRPYNGPGGNNADQIPKDNEDGFTNHPNTPGSDRALTGS